MSFEFSSNIAESEKSEKKTEVAKADVQNLVRKMLEEHLADFPEEVRPVIERGLSGKHLKSKQKAHYDKAVDEWWQERFGFPFTDKEERLRVVLDYFDAEMAPEQDPRLSQGVDEYLERKGEIFSGQDCIEHIEKVPNPTEIVRMELRSDLHSFDDEEAEVIERWLDGEHLEGEEFALFLKARNRWFKDKYGFAFKKGTACDEVLKRKYQPEHRESLVQEIQEDLFSAVRAGDRGRMIQLRRTYERLFPDRLESITALFETLQYLEDEAWLASHQEEQASHQEKMEHLRSATESQFLLTHHVLVHADDREHMERFWEMAEHLGKEQGRLRTVQKLRRSAISQASVYHLFKELGFSPRLSHPDEDAFDAVDMWADTEGHDVVQVKGAEDKYLAESGGSMIFEETDFLSFPTTQVNASEETEYHFSSYQQEMFNKYKVKMQKLAKQRKKNMRGFFVVAPYSKMDFVTGKLDQELIEKTREHVATILPPHDA